MVIARIYGVGRGNVFTPSDFRDLAKPTTIHQILQRLTSQGTIRRVRRGVYEYPERSVILKATAEPDPDAVARAIARSHGWTVVPTGEAALNRLGLATQVPSKWEYFTDGPTKKFPWLGGTIVFKHRANKETTGLSASTALVIQALRALGKSRIDDETIGALARALTAKQITRAAREARYATAWVYEAIKQLARRHGAPNA